jgi:hypothetical protein
MTSTKKTGERKVAMNQGYKFLTADMRSKHGESGVWKVGEWKKHDGELVMCQEGFHYCKEPLDAFEYVYGDSLVVVEARGEEITDDNKTVVQEMRVIKVVDTKKVAVQFAIACARRALPNYENVYPKDDRVRKVIEAAETWFANPTEENMKAAASAALAASAAWSAESAAWSAAWLAVRSAAWSAAESAESAARSAAWLAAWSAVRSAAWLAAWLAEKKWQNETLRTIIEESPPVVLT